jgi:uncharacterized protein (TIGR02147 family)
VKANLAGLLQITKPSGFRLYLQSELARRCVANPQYSLRSFALQLGINHSTLSQLLRGKRAFTPHTIVMLGGRLGLSQAEMEIFVVRERQTGNRAVSREIRVLTQDTLALLADGSHRAILELTVLPEFVPDSRWIARTLDLTVDEVNTALSRLTRLGLLEMREPNCWVDCSDASPESQDSFVQAVISRLSEQVRQLLVMSGSKLQEEDCAPAALNLRVSAAQLPALLDLLERFQREAVPRSAAQQYQLEIQIIPINST